MSGVSFSLKSRIIFPGYGRCITWTLLMPKTSTQFVGAPVLAGSSFDPTDEPKKKGKRTLPKKHRNNEDAMNFTIEKFRRFKKFLKKYGGKKFADGPTKKFGAQTYEDLTQHTYKQGYKAAVAAMDAGETQPDYYAAWLRYWQTPVGDTGDPLYPTEPRHGDKFARGFKQAVADVEAGRPGWGFADGPTKKFSFGNDEAYRAAEEEFKEYILPAIVQQYELDGFPDYPARAEAWNNYIDSISREGIVNGIPVTYGDTDEWEAPYWLDRRQFADRPTKKFAGEAPTGEGSPPRQADDPNRYVTIWRNVSGHWVIDRSYAFHYVDYLFKGQREIVDPYTGHTDKWFEKGVNPNQGGFADRPTKKFEDIDGFDVDTDDIYGALWAKAYRAGEAAGAGSSGLADQRAAWVPWARSEGIDPNHLSIKDAFHRGFDKSTGIDTEDVRGRHPSSGYAFADRPTKKFGLSGVVPSSAKNQVLAALAAIERVGLNSETSRIYDDAIGVYMDSMGIWGPDEFMAESNAMKWHYAKAAHGDPVFTGGFYSERPTKKFAANVVYDVVGVGYTLQLRMNDLPGYPIWKDFNFYGRSLKYAEIGLERFVLGPPGLEGEVIEENPFVEIGGPAWMGADGPTKKFGQITGHWWDLPGFQANFEAVEQGREAGRRWAQSKGVGGTWTDSESMSQADAYWATSIIGEWVPSDWETNPEVDWVLVRDLKTAFKDAWLEGADLSPYDAGTYEEKGNEYYPDGLYADGPTKHFTDGVKARSKFANILEAEEQYVAHMRKEATPVTEPQVEDFRDGYRNHKKFTEYWTDPTGAERSDLDLQAWQAGFDLAKEGGPYAEWPDVGFTRWAREMGISAFNYDLAEYQVLQRLFINGLEAGGRP